MRGAALIGLGLGVGLLAGCAPPVVTPVRNPAGASAPGTASRASPTPAVSGPASPNAAARLEAAKAYLVAARAYNDAKRALAPDATRNFEETRTYYRSLAKIEHGFLVAIGKVAFPADIRKRVDLLLKLSAESEAWQLRGSAARTPAALGKLEPSILRADQAASLAADLLRKDLGLPPIFL